MPPQTRRYPRIAGALLLTATAVGVALALNGCNNDDDEETVKSLIFSAVSVPETDAEKQAVRASTTATVDGTDYAIDYHTILRSGDTAGSGTFGQIVDVDGNAVQEADLSLKISNDNDFASLIPVGSKLFMVSHFESRPGAMYLTELNQDSATGALSPVSTRPIDFSGVNGGWVHCAGSVTPWNTHLGSEEYEPDAALRDPVTGDIQYYAGDTYYSAMAAYFGGDLLALNPYDYGWPVEVSVLDEDGNTTVAKHYAMGRMALELAYVLPDRKTAYLSDDGANVGLFMFVADTAGDLSAGRLYAMKWHQTSAADGGSADLTWIDLGHATDAEIKSYLDAKLEFGDLFETADPADAAPFCPDGFTSVNHGHNDGMQECLKLKSGMEKAASRLETRRYAAMLGATTELRKEEGITFDPATKRLFVAISEVSRGMEDYQKNGSDSTKYDQGGPNDIRLPYNLCGAVYALDLDTDAAVGSDYVAQNMTALVAGRMTQAWDPASDLPAYDPAGPLANNKCDLDGLANPDNLTFVPGYKTLIIGEDTGDGHQNDMIWAYNTESGSLTRIETTPYGSETTSPYFYPDINGWGYLMSVVQHPYGESDEDKLTNPDQARAYTGYIGPFPAMD